VLALAASLLVASCADPPLAPLEAEPGGPTAGLLGSLAQPIGLLQCSPLPYDSVTQAIGPEGGVVRVGRHKLSVPPGAVADVVTITAVAPSGTVNRVAFQPEGLVFERFAHLTMSYANCDLLGVLLPRQIAYVTDRLDILEYLPSVDHLLSQSVTGRLDHFSSYAVAW
jgi:hypothetical protein